MIKNTKLVLIVVALAIILITVVMLNSRQQEVTKPDVVTAYIREGNDVWEAKVEYPSGQTILYKNGVKQEVLQVLPTKEPKACMELPEINDTEAGINIEAIEQTQAITWKSDLKTSAKYLKFLRESGYTELRYASTKGYIEVYMKKDEITKRIIIFSDSIIVADVANSKLPELKNYYQ